MWDTGRTRNRGVSRLSRRQLGVWCLLVVTIGPVLNFVRDWRQEVPFYDHTAALAVAIGVILSVILGLTFSPALALMFNRKESGSSRRRALLAAVFAVCVWGTHFVAWLVASYDDLAERNNVWLLVYPIGSVIAWLAVARTRHEQISDWRASLSSWRGRGHLDDF